MPQTLTEPNKRPARSARWLGFAFLFSISFVASACATSPNPCGPRPVASEHRSVVAFRDPYTQRKQFERSITEYRAAIDRNSEEAKLIEARWKVCMSAQGFAPFTREVAADIRPNFTRALVSVVSVTRTHSDLSESDPVAVKIGVEDAIAELSSALPRFWKSPAASLRGSRQPGSPLHTHY